MKCMNNFSKNPFSLENKKYIITGASSGIGKAVSLWISSMGGEVAILARSTERLQKVFNELEGNNNRFIPIDLLAEENSIEKTINGLVSEWGAVNGMVHCAGIQTLTPLRGFHYDEYETTFRLNHGVFLLLSKVLTRRDNLLPNSSIVGISSAAALKGNSGLSIYGATKAALIASVRSLALEYASKGIRFNCVCPGWTDTPMLDEIHTILGEDLFQKKIVGPHPLGVGTPDDVAYAVIYLLSEASKWVTGSSFIIDGGLLA